MAKPKALPNEKGKGTNYLETPYIYAEGWIDDPEEPKPPREDDALEDVRQDAYYAWLETSDDEDAAMARWGNGDEM